MLVVWICSVTVLLRTTHNRCQGALAVDIVQSGSGARQALAGLAGIAACLATPDPHLHLLKAPWPPKARS